MAFDKRTLEKFKIYSSNFQKDLQEAIAPENLPPAYGGTCSCGDCMKGGGPFECPFLTHITVNARGIHSSSFSFLLRTPFFARSFFSLLRVSLVSTLLSSYVPCFDFFTSPSKQISRQQSLLQTKIAIWTFNGEQRIMTYSSRSSFRRKKE
jgi:hypothetical protein